MEYLSLWTKDTIYRKRGHISPPNQKEIKKIQAISGTFLYYGRVVDPKILTALNEISMQQPAPTQNTKKKCNRLLDYLYTNPNATIRYKASAMILQVDTDSAYLVLPKARSHSAGHYYLKNDNLKTHHITDQYIIFAKPYAMLYLHRRKLKPVAVF